jgi:purine-binding chemotaxis protein CheW
MGEEKKVIVFALGAEEYGVEVEKVRTIERMQPMTRVPKAPDFVKGVINLRGVVIPLDTDNIDTPPEIVGGIKAKYLDGIARVGEERLLVLLNLEQVLNRDEILQLERLGE